jgi:hypothetical protein
MKKVIIFSMLLIFGQLGWSHAMLIDFRSGDFSSADGLPSFTYNPAGLTINANPSGARLYQDSTDGIGIRHSYENDEIEGSERLHLSFSTPQYLEKITFTDLFYESKNYGSGSFYEKGQYSFDNSNWVSFQADFSQQSGTNGELTLSFASNPIITSVWFSAPGRQNWDNNYRGYLEDHEFSVAQIGVSSAAVDVSPTPEPSTMLLLGSGLVGLVGFRRKFRRR